VICGTSVFVGVDLLPAAPALTRLRQQIGHGDLAKLAVFNHHRGVVFRRENRFFLISPLLGMRLGKDIQPVIDQVEDPIQRHARGRVDRRLARSRASEGSAISMISCASSPVGWPDAYSSSRQRTIARSGSGPLSPVTIVD